MTIFKRLLVFVICIFCFAGCSDSNESIINNLESKYNETFSESVSLKSIAKGDVISVKCDSFPDDTILAGRVKSPSGEYVYKDNYLSYYFREQTYDKLKMCVDCLYNNAKVFYDVSDTLLSENFDKNTTFEEYSSKKDSDISFLIVASDFDGAKIQNDLEFLREALAENKIVAKCEIIYTTEGMIKSLDGDREGIEKKLKDDNLFKAIVSFEMNDNFELENIVNSENDLSVTVDLN